MKSKVLFKITNIAVVCTLLLVSLSCDKDDERIDFYKSQNRSHELKGWWRSIDDASENPYYILSEELRKFKK